MDAIATNLNIVSTHILISTIRNMRAAAMMITIVQEDLLIITPQAVLMTLHYALSALSDLSQVALITAGHQHQGEVPMERDASNQAAQTAATLFYLVCSVALLTLLVNLFASRVVHVILPVLSALTMASPPVVVQNHLINAQSAQREDSKPTEDHSLSHTTPAPPVMSQDTNLIIKNTAHPAQMSQITVLGNDTLHLVMMSPNIVLGSQHPEDTEEGPAESQEEFTLTSTNTQSETDSERSNTSQDPDATVATAQYAGKDKKDNADGEPI